MQPLLISMRPGSVLSDGRLTLEGQSVGEALAAIEAFLRESGVGPDAPVALECQNSVPGALTLLALLGRGATVALLLPASRPALAVPPPRFLRHLIRVRNPLLADRDVAVLRPASFLDIQPIDGHRALPVGSELTRGRLLLRTSGSLGTPKLVVHTHAGVLGNARNAVGRLGLQSGDRVLIPVPLAHMYGLGAGFLPALVAGASVELLEGANLLRYLERERSFQPTVAFLTPNLCAMLLRPRSTTANYRHAVVAGDKLGAEVFARAESIFRRVVALYGSTELGVICAMDASAAVPEPAMTVGRPLPGVGLRIEPLPGAAELEDGCGELLCAHPFGFVGYVDDEGMPLQSATSSLSGWSSPRDLARMHPDGSVEVLGRTDHATKRDGRLVMLAEVERVLGQLPGVERVLVALGGETIRGRAMIAFVTLRSPEGEHCDGAELRQRCVELLPAYAIPDELRPIAEFPMLPSGKVDRQRLTALACLPKRRKNTTDNREELGGRGQND